MHERSFFKIHTDARVFTNTNKDTLQFWSSAVVAVEIFIYFFAIILAVQYYFGKQTKISKNFSPNCLQQFYCNKQEPVNQWFFGWCHVKPQVSLVSVWARSYVLGEKTLQRVLMISRSRTSQFLQKIKFLVLCWTNINDQIHVASGTVPGTKEFLVVKKSSCSGRMPFHINPKELEIVPVA